MDRLVLWDIDRTLVNTVGIGALMFADALRATTGRDLQPVSDFAGKTDRELLVAVLDMNGIPIADATLDAFWAALADCSATYKPRMLASGKPLPGGSAALSALAAVPGVVQTVVTGNIAPIARLKLNLFGLDDHLDFDIGGYGSESCRRGEIVNMARERAAVKYGRELPGSAVVVIGDTVHDVAGALFSGAIAIGVATGVNSAEQLAQAGAHAVFEDLTDTAALLSAVLST